MHPGIVTAALLAAGCFYPATARAVAPEVRDNAGLFSAGALKQADETIRTIQREFRKDLLVESFAGVPEDRTEDYRRSREEFFANFVRERAQAARLDGIYVLIMKEPPPHRFRIQVGVGQATRQRAFLTADRDELVRLLQSSFRQERYDEGLREAVGFVQRALRNNLQIGSTARPSSPGPPLERTAPASSNASRSPMGSLLVVGLFIVGAVLVVGFLSRLLRGGMGGGGGVGGAGALGGRGGGGFFSSLLGGLGGAIAGSWIYDRFLGGNAHAADRSTFNQPDAPGSDVGGDYSSSGGDVDSGSGGDFGGGGDVGGGGDFGGGGDV